jgi:small subunit ribosomal protein S20
VATHKSALKASRQSEGRRLRNRSNRSQLRTQVKRFREALAEGKGEEAEALLKPTLSLLDRSVRLGAIHRNVADRTKSRLTRQLSKLSAGS